MSRAHTWLFGIAWRLTFARSVMERTKCDFRDAWALSATAQEDEPNWRYVKPEFLARLYDRSK